MKKTLTLLLCLSFLCFAGQLMAQKTVMGQVTSGADGSAIEGASVVVKNGTSGALSDANGNFKFEAPTGATDIIVTMTGYATQVLAITGGSMSISMSDSDLQLDEVVMTAFGVSRDKKSLGYAVQEVGGDVLVESRETNLVSALQGKIAGAVINTSSGAPGAGANITLRGITSLNPGASNQPLFVIDGIIVDNTTNSGSMLPSTGSNSPSSSEQASFSNRAIDINPGDIESISVLRGPAAAALYGKLAANGAIIITTKSGKDGIAKLNYTTSLTFDELSMYPEYQKKYREGRYGRLRFRSNGKPLRFQAFGPRVTETTPVFDNIPNFFTTGVRSENSISIAGGNNKANYYTSLSYLNQKGIVPHSQWNRLSARVKGNVEITKKLSVRSGFTYTNSGGRRPHSGDKSIFSSMSYHPLTFDINEHQNPDGSMLDYSAGIIDNPLFLAEFSTFDDDVNRIQGNVGINFKPFDWLDLDYIVGGDVYSDNRKRIVPAGLDLSSRVNGFVIEQRINKQNINSNLRATASYDLGEKISGFLMLGHQLIENKYDRISVRGEDLTIKGFYDLSNASNLFQSRGAYKTRLLGVFGNFNIGYNDMLFLDLTGRNDWSSTLPVESRSYFYPSATVSFVFSEALNASPDGFLTFGKIRMATVSAGSDLGPNNGIYFQNAIGFPWGGNTTGFRLSTRVPSDNLEAELTTSTEFGTELRFFKNRLMVDVTMYKAKTTNQLFSVPTAPTTGLTSFVTNVGEVQNKGIEALINLKLVDTKDFDWDMGINWSKNSGDIISLADEVDQVLVFSSGFAGIHTKYVAGGKVGDLYGYTFKYVNDQGEPIQANDPGGYPNGTKLIDANGFPVINTDSTVLVGNSLPDFVAGLSNSFTYKGIRLSALLEWRKGGDVYDMGRRNGIRNGVLAETELRYKKVVFNGRLENGEINTQEVEVTGETLYRNSRRYNRASEIILEDASWIRLRSLSLSYRLPTKSIGANSVIKGASFSLTGNNLFISTPFRGYDPESSYLGSGSNAFGFTGLTTPGTKSYTATVNLTF